MESLTAEHKKLKRDLEGLNASEPKIIAEIEQRRETLANMKLEMQVGVFRNYYNKTDERFFFLRFILIKSLLF